MQTADQRHRFYPNEFPRVEEVVAVRVKTMGEMGAYVSLLEYGDKEGMIQLSEVSRRRVRSVKNLLKVGDVDYAVVLRVDEEKGYIDLSKKRATPEIIAVAETRYNKSKSVNSLMRYVATHKSVSLQNLYAQLVFPLYASGTAVSVHPLDTYRLAITDPEKALAVLKESAEVDILEFFKETIQKRLATQLNHVRAEIDCNCFEYEGVDAIKAALNLACQIGPKVLKKATENTQIRARVVAAPRFILDVSVYDVEEGVALLNAAIQTTKKELEDRGGVLVVKGEPKCVSERDSVPKVEGDKEEEEGEGEDGEKSSEDDEEGF